MEPGDLEKFANAIMALAAAWRVTADRATFEAYKMGLGDLPIEKIQVAVARAIRECPRMPSPAELRELSGEHSLKDRALKMLGIVRRAQADHGPYRTVSFDCPIINAVIRDLGGWPWLCDVTDDAYAFTEKELERRYIMYCKTGISTEQGAKLLGKLDQANSGNGYDLQPVQVIETGLEPLTRKMVANETPRFLALETTA